MGDPHMPNPPGSPQNYCYVVNARTAWLKEGVGSTYSDGEWGQWFGLLVLDPEDSDASKGLYGAEGSGTVPGTADQGFVAASQEIQRIYGVRKDPHMPNPPGSPQNYCYVVNALTAWLKEGVGSTYSDGEWGQWFGLLGPSPASE